MALEFGALRFQYLFYKTKMDSKTKKKNVNPHTILKITQNHISKSSCKISAR